MTVMGFRVGPLLKATGKEILDDGVTSLAAQTAYYFFFSLFPLLLFLAPLLTLVIEPATLIGFVTEHLSGALPARAMPAVEYALSHVVFVPNAPGLMSAGILLAAWSGSNIFGALINALNTAYDVEDRRPFWKQVLVRFAMLGIGGLVILVATVVMLAGDDIARFVGERLGVAQETVRLWTLAQFPLVFAFLVLFGTLIYWILPNVKQQLSHVVFAALVTAVLWLLATMLFRMYVQRFPPNPAYGLIGAVMILLTWMYVSMFVVLAGGELAAEMHRGTGAVAPRKGATYNGRIVSTDLTQQPDATER